MSSICNCRSQFATLMCMKTRGRRRRRRSWLSGHGYMLPYETASHMSRIVKRHKCRLWVPVHQTDIKNMKCLHSPIRLHVPLHLLIVLYNFTFLLYKLVWAGLSQPIAVVKLYNRGPGMNATELNRTKMSRMEVNWIELN